MNKFCVNCGFKLSESDKFCTNCGTCFEDLTSSNDTPLSEETTSEETKEDSSAVETEEKTVAEEVAETEKTGDVSESEKSTETEKTEESSEAEEASKPVIVPLIDPINDAPTSGSSIKNVEPLPAPVIPAVPVAPTAPNNPAPVKAAVPATYNAPVVPPSYEYVPPRSSDNQASSDDNKTGNIYAVISLVLVLTFPASVVLTEELGEYLPDVIRNLFYSVNLLVPLTGIVLMIIGRVKFPKNTFLKVLMWVYISFAIIMVIATVAVMIACAVLCSSCRGM